jgi:excisionase family DNA binding protein
MPRARLWNVQEAAAYLGVRPSWIYEACRARRLPVVPVGKHLRFLQEDLDAWIAERRIEARGGAHRSSSSAVSLRRAREFDRL